jgi:type VI secretion system secreted protein Hcp
MSLIRKYFAVLLMLLSFSTVSQAQITGPTYLEIGPGQRLEILAWSWGASQSGTLHSGGGGGAGKANFQDLSITRNTDSYSPNFLMAVARGTHIESMKLIRGFLTITISPVIVTSYSVGGASGHKNVMTENITLNFAEVEYKISDAIFCWDAEVNAICN